MTPEDEEKVISLYESGLTIYEVIERVGYSYGVITGCSISEGSRFVHEDIRDSRAT